MFENLLKFFGKGKPVRSIDLQMMRRYQIERRKQISPTKEADVSKLGDPSASLGPAVFDPGGLNPFPEINRPIGVEFTGFRLAHPKSGRFLWSLQEPRCVSFAQKS